jgi:hypothetical protein
MALIDDLVGTVDVDTAYEAIVARHAAAERRAKRARLVLAAACLVALAGLAWLAWPGDDDGERVDQVGEQEEGDRVRTPASVTQRGDHGLVVTMAVDDDIVAVGETVAITVTTQNEGDEALVFSGVDDFSFCPTTIDVLTGRGFGFPDYRTGANSRWPGGSDTLAEDALGNPDAPAVPISDYAVEAPADLPPTEVAMLGLCGEVDTTEIGPGESHTARLSWTAAFTPGPLPPDGQLLFRGSAESWRIGEQRGDLVAPVTLELPFVVADAGRLTAPTPEQLAAAVDDPEVHTALRAIGPLGDGFGTSFGQVDRYWLLVVWSAETRVDVWLDGNGELVTFASPDWLGPVTLPAAPTPPAIGGPIPRPTLGSDAPADETPASSSTVMPAGVRFAVEIGDDHVLVGDVVDITVTLTNEGDEAVPCPLGELGGTIATPDYGALGSQGPPVAWSGDRRFLYGHLNPDPPRVFGQEPTTISFASEGECPGGAELAPGESVTALGSWGAWYSPGEVAAEELLVDVSLAGCPGCEDDRVRVQVPFVVIDTDRPEGPTREQLDAAVVRTDVQAILDAAGLHPARPLQPPSYTVVMVQVGRDWLLRIEGVEGAADVWIAGEGDDAGEVIEVQEHEPGGPVDPPG